MAIQIYILGKLMQDNNYPYKLKKELSEPIPFDQLGGVTESKLYYHFESLVKQGLIEPVEIIKEEHRPDKQVFAITDKGREALPQKIYQLFGNADTISGMVIALANIEYVDREKVIELLYQKLARIKEHWAHIKDLEIKVQLSEEKEHLVKYLGEYFSSKKEHTTYWLEELIKRIERNEI
ncbi:MULTISPECIES: PadR family transcriptional regulator [Psychrobacillus]|uniref:Helix-turn-helix transcriptional regulator n=1 Tax=Psychrobacillus faecigallinarum TaxID=2762235 RepID=A0ABR8RCD3_9BACI|nr:MULTISPECIES: helix-turn-helix transcriptional regulator [Psychrobacillus]MBD7945453.1 helix-turn-helix transcriptional regulator [Psychrobacillus faecigallinarum]QEY21692.1 PadR family transcriptional regulator [Psychrobacillus sp. AK 1817]QGM32145.1 PadR family transcriptional regulator [Bacillus sp. N3536]